jgi:hypothetical protein
LLVNFRKFRKSFEYAKENNHKNITVEYNDKITFLYNIIEDIIRKYDESDTEFEDFDNSDIFIDYSDNYCTYSEFDKCVDFWFTKKHKI